MVPRPLTICGTATLLVSSASTIITLLIAIALLNKRSSIWPLAIAAAVLDIFTLAWIAYMLASSMASESYGRRKSLGTFRLIASMLLGSIAALATLASLVWIQLRPASATATLFGNSLFTLQEADYGLLGGAVVLQCVFAGLWTRTHAVIKLSSGNDATAQPPALPEVRIPHNAHGLQPAQVQVISQALTPVERRHSIASSHSSLSQTSKAPSSRRSSFNDRGVRPMTSRSRLIRPHSWTPTSSIVQHRPQSSTSSKRATYSPVGPIGIGEWQRRRSSTSEHELEELPARPETPYRTRLEPIPGSRANSPGRPLDGPYLDQSKQASGLPEHSVKSENAELPDKDCASRPHLERFVTAPTSPLNEDESHIHPLFRTASPLPPPNASSGTIVTASELAGQWVTPKTLQRATSHRRTRNSLYDPSRARSHSRLGARARQQQLPIPHTIVRARSLETMDSWQTRLEEGENQVTMQQLAASLSKPKLVLVGKENSVPQSSIPDSLQVKVPTNRQSSSPVAGARPTLSTTPRRALSEVSGNSPKRSPRRSSPRKSKDVQRSSLNVNRRRSEAVPDIQIYVDPAEE